MTYVSAPGLPMFAGFGEGERVVVPFYAQSDPAAVLIRAVQTYLVVPATGVWDRATHEAYIRAVFPAGPRIPWGSPGLNIDIWVRPDLEKTGPLDPEAARMAGLLGLPMDTWENLNADLTGHSAEIAAVVAEANRRIDAAEAAATRAASSMKWWILGGAAVAALVVGAVVISSRDKKESS